MKHDMQAAVYKSPGKLEIESIPVLDINQNDVLVKVWNCGICGSDLHSYKLGSYIEPGSVMGHEFSGLAHAVGSNVKGVKEGDRVTGFAIGACGNCYWCNKGDIMLCPELFHNSTGYGRPGAFSEFVRIENAVVGESIHVIPEEVSDVAAATVEPIAVGISAVDAAKINPGDKVVVLGSGMIGNACMQAAKQAGAGIVAIIDLSTLRLNAAKDLGADLTHNPRDGNSLEWVKDNIGIGRYHFHEGGMADVVIETAGSPETITESFEMVRSGGTIVFVGLPEKPATLDITKIVHKQPNIIGSLGGDFSRALELLKNGTIVSDKLVSHNFPLSSIQMAFKLQMDPNESIKVMITCSK